MFVLNRKTENNNNNNGTGKAAIGSIAQKDGAWVW
jgi:hypothetical protein